MTKGPRVAASLRMARLRAPSIAGSLLQWTTTGSPVGRPLLLCEKRWPPGRGDGLAGELGLRGQKCFELVEPVRPTVPVKRAASLGLEQTLSEHDFGRLAEIPEGEVDDSLDVVGIGVLPSERVRETGWSIDHAELASQIEGVPLAAASRFGSSPRRWDRTPDSAC